MPKHLDKAIIEAIVARTSLSANQIKTWDIERIEEEIGIKAVAPKNILPGKRVKNRVGRFPHTNLYLE